MRGPADALNVDALLADAEVGGAGGGENRAWALWAMLQRVAAHWARQAPAAVAASDALELDRRVARPAYLRFADGIGMPQLYPAVPPAALRAQFFAGAHHLLAWRSGIAAWRAHVRASRFWWGGYYNDDNDNENREQQDKEGEQQFERQLLRLLPHAGLSGREASVWRAAIVSPSDAEGVVHAWRRALSEPGASARSADEQLRAAARAAWNGLVGERLRTGCVYRERLAAVLAHFVHGPLPLPRAGTLLGEAVLAVGRGADTVARFSLLEITTISEEFNLWASAAAGDDAADAAREGARRRACAATSAALDGVARADAARLPSVAFEAAAVAAGAFVDADAEDRDQRFEDALYASVAEPLLGMSRAAFDDEMLRPDAGDDGTGGERALFEQRGRLVYPVLAIRRRIALFAAAAYAQRAAAVSAAFARAAQQQQQRAFIEEAWARRALPADLRASTSIFFVSLAGVRSAERTMRDALRRAAPAAAEAALPVVVIAAGNDGWAAAHVFFASGGGRRDVVEYATVDPRGAALRAYSAAVYAHMNYARSTERRAGAFSDDFVYAARPTTAAAPAGSPEDPFALFLEGGDAPVPRMLNNETLHLAYCAWVAECALRLGDAERAQRFLGAVQLLPLLMAVPWHIELDYSWRILEGL